MIQLTPEERESIARQIELFQSRLKLIQAEQDNLGAQQQKLAIEAVHFSQAVKSLVGILASDEEVQVGPNGSAVASGQLDTGAMSSLAQELVRVRPREGVLRLLREDPRPWSVDELKQEMMRRGWLSTDEYARPTEAVRAAARRLAEVEKLISRTPPSTFQPIATEEVLIAK